MLTKFQIDYIKYGTERTIVLAGMFGLTQHQVLDIQGNVKPREIEIGFRLGRGPGTQRAVNEILTGGRTPLGSIYLASGFRIEIIDGVEVKVPWGPEGDKFTRNWELINETE